MMMRLHDSRTQKQMFEVQLAAERFKHPLSNAAFTPAVETLENRVPIAESLGKFPPRSAGFRNPDDGIDEEPIVFPNYPGSPLRPGRNGSIRTR
jgi:hypothetical protein